MQIMAVVENGRVRWCEAPSQILAAAGATVFEGIETLPEDFKPKESVAERLKSWGKHLKSLARRETVLADLLEEWPTLGALLSQCLSTADVPQQ